MTQKEFEDRTGIQLTMDQYTDVEAIYMMAGNMDKDEFCREYKKHKDSKLLDMFYNQAKAAKAEIDRLLNERSKTIDFLLRMAELTGEKAITGKVHRMADHGYCIKRKIRMGLPLSTEDMEYIENNI